METNSIQERVLLNKTRKYANKLPPNELALIIALTMYTDYSKNGWMTQREILLKKGTDGLKLFKLGDTNFPKYIKSLIKKGFVEGDIYSDCDSRGRPRTKKIYRLRRNPQIRYYVYGSIVSSVNWTYDKLWQSNSKRSKFNILDNTVLRNTLTKSDYFNDIDRIYGDILDEQIHHYEIQIQLLKNIKKLRSMKKQGETTLQLLERVGGKLEVNK